MLGCSCRVMQLQYFRKRSECTAQAVTMNLCSEVTGINQVVCDLVEEEWPG